MFRTPEMLAISPFADAFLIVAAVAVAIAVLAGFLWLCCLISDARKRRQARERRIELARMRELRIAGEDFSRDREDYLDWLENQHRNGRSV
jgi:hypothetical protein